MKSKSCIIVLERRPQWRPELQREFQSGHATESSVDVFGCDSLRELLQTRATLHSQAVPFVTVLDLRFSLNQVLQFLAQSQAGLPVGATVILGTVEHVILEPTLRELGASSFQVLPLQRERLGEVCRRLLAVGCWSPAFRRS